jgi:hypothetical protein
LCTRCIVITTGRPTKVLNYITAPDTVIWSAMLATAAVPGILNPVVLMQKLKSGRLVPWNWGSKFKDGSLRSVDLQRFPSSFAYDPCRVDIPLQSLHLLFNGRPRVDVAHITLTHSHPRSHTPCRCTSESPCAFVLLCSARVCR